MHICAWPLEHSRPAIHFGISFVLLHWLMGMVSRVIMFAWHQLLITSVTETVRYALTGRVSRRPLNMYGLQGFLMATACFLSISRSILHPGMSADPSK